jgi:pimeloyl-ACP methyl ester carboxylesterase
MITRLPRQYADDHGQRIAYASVGTGPLVLLLHGLGGTADFWQPAIERLVNRYSLLIPDLLGFGYSDKPATGYNLPGHVAAIRAVLHATQTEQVHALVSHSAGGVVAVGLIAEGYLQPDRILLAASAYPSPRFPVRQELVTNPWFGRLLDNRRLARIDDRFFRIIWPIARRIAERRIEPALQGGLVGFMDYSADSMYSTAAELLLKSDLDPLLPRLRNLPTLLMYGLFDRTVPYVHGERIAAVLPQAEYILLEADHYAIIREGLPHLVAWLDRDLPDI